VRIRRAPILVVAAALALLGATANAAVATPRLRGTFAMRFRVLEANHVKPGVGATGSRTWIFERENKKLYLLEGLANGGYARVQLKRSGNTFSGVSRLRATCIDDASMSGLDVSTYSVTITRSAVRAGHLVATSIEARLQGTYSGCGQASASDLRRYRGHLVSLT
jgi:hypothetical protein